MKIPYRTRRTINRIGFVSLMLLMALAVFWFCWVIFAQRYVVYTRDGAVLDLSYSSNDLFGEVAMPPQADEEVSIYYNEGDTSIELGNALTQRDGYYITADDLTKNLGTVWSNIERLPMGSTVMIDLKGGYGSFYYSTNLSDGIRSQSVATASVDELIKLMQQRGFYTIARVSAFRDYNYGLNHVPNGLYMSNRKGLWADAGGCYWLDPTNAATLNWVASVVLEVKALGFREVVLTDFCFPNTDKIYFNGDKNAAIVEAAQKMMTMCGDDSFTLSFGTNRSDFPLPEGRSRIFFENVEAADVGAKVTASGIEEPEIRIVFVAPTNDTRFNAYGVLHSLSVADVLEAQKAEKDKEE